MMSLDDLQNKLNHYVTQRNQTQRAYEQLCGAIHVLEEQIKAVNKKEHEAKAKAEQAAQEAQDDKDLAELNEPAKGDADNGNLDGEAAQETA